MSIWCTWATIGHDGSAPGEVHRRGEVRTYVEGWSNHYPDRVVERPASVNIDHIPTWCVPGHGEPDDWEDKPYGGWVRLNVTRWFYFGTWSHSVVMDERAARALAADLLEWADAPKVHPPGWRKKRLGRDER